MRYFMLALLAVVLTSCIPSSPAGDAKSSRLLLGTWQWVRFDQQPVHAPFYIRFYSDGRAATWPVLRECVYHVEGKYLIIRTGTGHSNARVKLRLKGDRMIMIGSDTNRFLYHRVVPALRPGQFIPGQVHSGSTPYLIIKLLRLNPVREPTTTAS